MSIDGVEEAEVIEEIIDNPEQDLDEEIPAAGETAHEELGEESAKDEQPNQEGALREALSALDEISAKLDAMSQRFEDRIARNEFEDNMLKKHSDEVQEHKNDLYIKIMRPLIAEVCKYHDMLRTMVMMAQSNNPDNPVIAANQVGMIKDSLGRVLEDFGVEMLELQANQDFDRNAMGNLVTFSAGVKTGDESLAGKLARVSGIGYSLYGKNIMKARVSPYVYDASLATQVEDND